MVSVEDFDEPDEPPEQDISDDDDDDDDEDDDADMVLDDSSECEEFAEYDSSGRYGRYDELLGKGAMKTVYRAYDLVDCKEVAWNKARLPVECSEEQAMAVRREIQLLQGINHRGIIKLYCAWDDECSGETNFITELCSSTLLEYRIKHKHVSRKAVRSWGRQILKGLAHLHMQVPPIIHRDLKCENILVKCSSNTALKIGDFGSATFLDETQHMHTLVGTPEFMAPEMFEEDYNELVDVYSFGMCMLELLTRECPYSECKSLAQIYKKVTHGEKPKALHKVKDVQALKLINRCLQPASKRPSASELLSDPFLQCHRASFNEGQSMKSSISMPDLKVSTSNCGVKKVSSGRNVNRHKAKPSAAMRTKGGESADFESLAATSGCAGKLSICTKSPSFRRTYCVMGRVEDQFTLRLKIRIQESGRSCDIDFPFDLRYDSPRSVAEEMVRALDYPESDLITIANLISKEIAELAPSLEENFAEMQAMEGLSLKQCEEAHSNGYCNGNNAGQMGEWGQGSFHEEVVSNGNPNIAAGWLPSNVSSVVFTKSLAGGRMGNTAYIKIRNPSDEKRACDMPMLKSDIKLLTDIMDYSHESPGKGSEVANCKMNGIVNRASPSPIPAEDQNTCLATCVSGDADESMKSSLQCVHTSGASEQCPAQGGTNLRGRIAALAKSCRRMSPSRCPPKNSFRFQQQLPAGIGILLLPSSQLGLRRALPSIVNASV